MEHTPRISVRLPEDDIAWLKETYGTTTQGVKRAVEHLRACMSVVSLLEDHFSRDERVSVGALLMRVDLSYPRLMALLYQARDSKAIKIIVGESSGRRGYDLEVAGYLVAKGPRFTDWASGIQV